MVFELHRSSVQDTPAVSASSRGRVPPTELSPRLPRVTLTAFPWTLPVHRHILMLSMGAVLVTHGHLSDANIIPLVQPPPARAFNQPGQA